MNGVEGGVPERAGGECGRGCRRDTPALDPLHMAVTPSNETTTNDGVGRRDGGELLKRACMRSKTLEGVRGWGFSQKPLFEVALVNGVRGGDLPQCLGCVGEYPIPAI